MTLEAWVSPSTINNWETVVLKERPGGLAYSLYAGSPAGPPAGYITPTGTSTEIGADGPLSLALDAWSHLAATYDGTTIRLYVNGTLVQSQAAAGGIMTSSNPLRIGGNSIWNSEYFAGLIDEVRVYNRVLTAAEIAADMNAPLLPPVALAGDYNADHTVDAADYVLWRKLLGSNSVMPNDPTAGSVTQADFNVWSANFGESGSGGGQQAAGGAPIAGASYASAAAADSDRRPEKPLVSRMSELPPPRMDSSLLAHYSQLERTLHLEPSAFTSEIEPNQEFQDSGKFSYFEAFDVIFAELEVSWNVGRRG
jgi:hypothetical protein